MSSPADDKAQPLVEHLLELRQRLLRIVLVVTGLFLALIYFANPIYTFVAQPLLNALPAGSHMLATDVASPFMAPVKLVFVLCVFLAIPYILFELWQFIAPGLFAHERRLAVPLLSGSVLLFYAGALFAYYLIFPVMFAFFNATVPEGITYAPDISKFLDTILALLFAFGVVFEIPVVTFLLVYTGITTAEALAGKRRYVIVICFTIAMFLTPPDPLSQIMMAVPMCLLYEAGIIWARWFIKSKSATPDGEPSPED